MDVGTRKPTGKTKMKTHFIAPAFAALLLALTFAMPSSAMAETDGLDTLKSAKTNKAAVSRFQHHLAPTTKRNCFRLAVASPDCETTEMRVYDQQGTLVHRSDSKGDTVIRELDVNLLQPGDYTLKIIAGENSAEKKFTVR